MRPAATPSRNPKRRAAEVLLADSEIFSVIGYASNAKCFKMHIGIGL